MSNKYKLGRPLDDELLNDINNLADGSVIEFKNTRNVSPEYIKRIKPTIKIRIVGGLDEKAKPKFKDMDYFERTLYSPMEVYKIIKKMESIEEKINPNWTDLEKAMYIYKVICEHMKYDHIDVRLNGRDYNRNLLGFLTGKTVCAGFSMMYKEMLDRQGIVCHYQNKQHGHAWNLVEINGKLIPVDLTWDNTLNEYQNNRCDFAWFGRNRFFFDDKNHIVTGEPVLKTSFLSEEEFQRAYNNIANNKKLSKKMNVITNHRGEKTYYTTIKENNFKRCFIIKNNQMKSFLFDDTIELENIFKYDLFLYNQDNFVFTNNKSVEHEMKLLNNNTKIYKRKDGSTFFLSTGGISNKGVIPHKYVSFKYTPEGVILEGEILKSDENLLAAASILQDGIANVLLSTDRVKQKADKFNGYVGYIGMEKGRYVKYASSDIEQAISGIKRF